VKKRRFILIGMLIPGVLMLAGGCSNKLDEGRAEKGNIVQVEYTGKLTDGSVFDTSVGRQPLEFTIGAGQMIAGFDKAVLGMKTGESKTVTIPTAEAYGQHRDDLVIVIPRSQLPESLNPAVGQQLPMTRNDGMPVTVTVTAVTDTSITVDANHKLAGKDLIFEIKLISIK